MTDASAIRGTTIYASDTADGLGSGAACGDVDGDGTDDLIVGAEFADGPGNARPEAGEVRIIFGRPNMPQVIDLKTDSAPAIYGQINDGRIGNKAIAVCDLNGDGKQDIVLGASRHPGKNGSGTKVGRAYLLFGRAVWPPTLDLGAAVANVTIYGQKALDGFGFHLACGDLDLDSRPDLISSASGGDGPNGTRPNSGEVDVFVGRSSWPNSIDLATTTPDSRIFGFDQDDHLPESRGIAVGDIDGDGKPDLLLGAGDADGTDNSLSQAGEARTYQPG